ncbi:AraC family transcriptional regulator [Dysgonomonas sp. HDW5B]|uniref:helix-turn-helix domain-containing protein n=1 Tax=Dysgonomonas sp. HDW5B TaxID=2714927 RepID=UPI001407E699|nr:helix-turn-helix domain-containing protein [Dysgonomonas sp. HDW5B]QIK55187.1 AraC family transcriptional regulator [Dysgonomonas sp. HDW5B]
MNIKTKRGLILTLFFLSFIPFSIVAQSQDVLQMKEALISKIDSCNKNLLKLDQKLKISMMTMANKSREYDAMAEFFNQKKLFGEEYQILMYKYMYKDTSPNNLDSIYYYFKKSDNQYLNSHEDVTLLINSLRGHFVAWCSNNSYSELAIHTLKQNIEYNSIRKLNDNLWTYLRLVQIYRTTGNHKQAIESGKTGLNQANTHKLAFELKVCIASEIAESYYILGDFQNSLVYCDSILSYTHNIPDKFQPELGSNFYNLALIDFYAMTSAAYSSTKNFEQALVMLGKLEAIFPKAKILGYPDNARDQFLAQKNWVNMVYNYQKGDYAKAMEYLNKNKELAIPFALTPDYKNTPKWEALINEKLGNYKEANSALKDQLHFTDSINRANTDKEVSSLWATFEVDKAQQAKENSESKVRIIAISTSIIIFISAILLIYFVVTNRKLKKKNQLLFKQQKNQSSTIPFVINRKEEASQEEISENTEQTLYLRIIEYLQTSRQYTDSAISRESLAKELGTNRQYIIDAISNNANMSFNEFINNFRIDYARDLLLNEDNILIKEVYTEAGFKNRNTFSQLFKEKFGMSPSEFRECANEEKIKR